MTILWIATVGALALSCVVIFTNFLWAFGRLKHYSSAFNQLASAVISEAPIESESWSVVSEYLGTRREARRQ